AAKSSLRTVLPARSGSAKPGAGVPSATMNDETAMPQAYKPTGQKTTVQLPGRPAPRLGQNSGSGSGAGGARASRAGPVLARLPTGALTGRSSKAATTGGAGGWSRPVASAAGSSQAGQSDRGSTSGIRGCTSRSAPTAAVVTMAQLTSRSAPPPQNSYRPASARTDPSRGVT